MRLTDLRKNTPAQVAAVEDQRPQDPVSGRLRDLGFVAGEAVQVVALGPVGADPLVVRIGSTRFALRRAEASRVIVQLPAA